MTEGRRLTNGIVSHYVELHPTSGRLHQRAIRLFPDGVTHDLRRNTPFPLYVDRAAGSRKWDVDGNELVDYVMGHGALLLGHQHPVVVDAIAAQARLGTHYGAAHEPRCAGANSCNNWCHPRNGCDSRRPARRPR